MLIRFSWNAHVHTPRTQPELRTHSDRFPQIDLYRLLCNMLPIYRTIRDIEQHLEELRQPVFPERRQKYHQYFFDFLCCYPYPVPVFFFMNVVISNASSDNSMHVRSRPEKTCTHPRILSKIYDHHDSYQYHETFSMPHDVSS